MTKPLATALLVRALARRRATLEDELGRVQVVSIRHLARLAGAAARDRWRVPSRLRRVEHDVGALELGNRSSQLELSRPPLYLRSDLWFGMPSGGSMGHISGVVNELSAAGTGPPIFVTTDTIGGVKPGVRTHVVPPGRRFWDFRRSPRSPTDSTVGAGLLDDLGGERRASSTSVTRSTAMRDCAARASAWRARSCSSTTAPRSGSTETGAGGSSTRRLSERIEIAEPAGRGPRRRGQRGDARRAPRTRSIPDERILVNPNGVDPDRYRPDIDGSASPRSARSRWNVVIGFIGTFGPWHGAEVLADAFGAPARRRPDLREQVRLLMIGDGPTPRGDAAACRPVARSETVFAGRTARRTGPAYLAACDILVVAACPERGRLSVLRVADQAVRVHGDGQPIVASRAGADRRGPGARPDGVARSPRRR